MHMNTGMKIPIQKENYILLRGRSMMLEQGLLWLNSAENVCLNCSNILN